MSDELETGQESRRLRRSSDADLCRLRGWRPGDLLQFTDARSPRGLDWFYELTAVGVRSILVRSVGSDDGLPYGTERQFTERLHDYAIRKVSREEILEAFGRRLGRK